MTHYEHFVVGYLLPEFMYLVCFDCYESDFRQLTTAVNPVKVYRENIGIYSQLCHYCSKTLVDGAKSARDGKPLQLFDKPFNGALNVICTLAR